MCAVAFDLAENELQHFLIRVRNALPDPAAKPAAAEPTTSAEAEGEKPADAEPASTETTMAEAEPTDEEKKYIEKMGKLKQASLLCLICIPVTVSTCLKLPTGFHCFCGGQ